MTMKAVRIHQYGDGSTLQLEDVPIPTPQNDQVQVRVAAVSINPVEWKIREGMLAARMGNPFPFILGYDVSGVVSAIGDEVTDFKVGDEVYGMVNFPLPGGGYAEYVTAPADHLAPKPTSLSHVEAAALPLVTLTAWQALFEAAQLSAGQCVLIHAAAGGVGHVAVQLAKWKNAHVIGTASAANEQYLRELGVDTFINYREAQIDEALKDAPVDVVLGAIPGDAIDQSFKVLKPDGILTSIVGDPSGQAKKHGRRGVRVLVRADQAQLTEITSLIDSGVLRPTIGGVFPLENVQEAHQQSETGRVRGKLVLEMAE